MNGVQNKNGKGRKKPVPGCMSRMINVFDMSVSTAGPMMLTERSHSDGLPIHRNRPDVVKKAIDTAGRNLENKPGAPEQAKSSSRKKSGRISMKMLLAQEMSEDMESKQKPPNIVARLMGLETLPAQQPLLAFQRSSEALHDFQQLEDGYMENLIPCDVHLCDCEEYQYVHEVWQQPRTTEINTQTPQREAPYENLNEKKMAFVRQKFTEAKCSSSDENLFESKGFQDALKVLSSNKDLFLSYLEEPNSLLSKHLNELHTSSPLSQTQCITVLKPSKTDDEKKRQYETQKQRRSSNFAHTKTEKLSQPTSIVVLKPQNIRVPVSPNTSFKLPEGIDYHGGRGTDDTEESREVARKIMQQMRECLGGEQRNETFFPIFANRYVGDDSSLSRSENEYIDREGGDFSDMEIVTPTSQYSWDHSNRFGSPGSPSSYGGTSCSQDSSVIREAKRRLSERLALVASNGTNLRQRQVRGRSSTLGDMLALPEIHRAEDDAGSELNLRPQFACLSIGSTKDGSSVEKSTLNLSRSKSVPVSSSAFENSCFDVEVSKNLLSKPTLLDDVTNSRNMKSYFKGNVSSLFFPRNRKPGGEKSFPEESPLINSFKKSKSSFIPSSKDDQPARCLLTAKVDPPLSETQDQPSPSSVLDAPFKDDANNTTFQSCHFDDVGHFESQSLSRSRPIESIARSLPWDDNCSKISSPNQLRTSLRDTVEVWFEFAHKLLSFAGFVNGTWSTFFTRWHSPDSPLDPILVHEFVVQTEERTKPRDRVLDRRLVFDCVNEALLDIGQNAVSDACLWLGTHCSYWEGGEAMSEQVWGLVRDWFSGNWKCISIEDTTEVLDRVVKGEVTGRKWAEFMWWEMDEFCKEVGGELLDELVGEALAET